MATRNHNIPRSEHDPLDDADDIEEAQRVSAPGRGRLHDEEGDHDAHIQKGMPARNLKTILMVVLLGGLLAFLMIPRHKDVKLPEVDAKPARGSIADDLVKNLQNRPTPIAPVSLDPKPVLPVAEKAPPPVDERIQAALVSSMAATDVTFNTAAAVKVKKTASAQTAGGGVSLADQQKRDAQTQLEALQKQLGGSGSAAPVRSATALRGEKQSGLSHEAFVDGQVTSGIGNTTKLAPARTQSTLYEGTIIRAALTRAIKTDLPGTFTAKVTSDLFDTVSQREILVPRGSEITCRYQSELLVGQKVVLSACTRLRLPNGKSFSLSAATASDMQGASGLPADVDNHFFEMFRDALIVGAASYLLPNGDRAITVSSNDTSSNVGGAIAGSALKQIIDTTIGRNIRIPPTGAVEIGTPFTLTLTRDVELEPYFKQ